MVLTLLPLTTTSRRRGCACPCPCGSELAAAALCIAQPVKAIALAGVLGTRSPLKAIYIPRCVSSVGSGAYNALAAKSLQGEPWSSRPPRLRWLPLPESPLSMADHDHDPHHE